ncbi:uncharacterized protein LOC125312929 [Rhodamnia argentea]|uniref:Uncharacterized protein LOC125312929 n=1 Tax=Rhodamnia argentea TaxID=178133 RepID=A0ABM3GXB0_9MYRT|nr:uncharacterized protein LOC125312929 [Rhodamnia argentea]
MYQNLMQHYWWKDLYMKHIVRLDGVPVMINSTCDPKFTVTFWKSLLAALGTKLRFGMARHSQTDSRSKRTIQTLEDMLRACVLDFKGSWKEQLRLVEFAYNNGFQQSIKMTPFEALEKGKLSPMYVGPFEILELIRNLAYPLALPLRSAPVHNVFYVSMLRKYEPDSAHVLSYEEIELDERAAYVERPIKIVDRKEQVLRSKTIQLVKVVLQHHEAEGATWENEKVIKSSYPYLFE